MRQRLYLRKNCSVEDCDRKAEYRDGLCKKHHVRWFRHGHTKQTRLPPVKRDNAYRWVNDGVRWLHEHVMLAEKALGRPLPLGAEVHHMNGDKKDNYTFMNLVICPNAKYHALLHKRAKLQKLGRLQCE